VVVAHPLAKFKEALFLCLKLVHVDVAVEELATKETDSHDGEDQINNSNDDEHVENVAYRLHESHDHHLQLDVVVDESERSKCSQHSKDLDDRDVDTCHGHIDDRGHDDEKIKPVPVLSQIRSIIHNQSHCNDFKHHFKQECEVEEEIDIQGHLLHLGGGVILQEVSVNCQLTRRQENEYLHSCFP
jgi:hypothetical protein